MTMQANLMICKVVRVMRLNGIVAALLVTTLYSSLATAASMPQLDAILKDYIKKNYPWADVELTDIVAADSIPEYAPERIFVLRGMPNKTLFSLEYKNGQKITASATIKTFDWVVMTRSAFRKGHMLGKDDIYMTLMDTSKIPKDAVKNIEKVVGMTLTRSVLANMPLSSDMTGESALIKKGAKVTIVAESGSISISAKGELKENGYVGNDVKVLNIDSKKIITGRLSSGNIVKVVF